MNYYLYKMSFVTPVHFGTSDGARSLDSSQSSVCADTLFSGLCHMALRDGGRQAVEELADWVREGSLLLTDAFPYYEMSSGTEYYVPKPFMRSEKHMDTDPADRKKMKKLTHIPISHMEEFCDSIFGKKRFDLKEDLPEFGFYRASIKAGITYWEKAQPYAVGEYYFGKNSGLYVIVRMEEGHKAILQKYMEFLGMSGLGGKVSSGYGRFARAQFLDLNRSGKQEKLLYYYLTRENADWYISMTTALPKEEELEESLENAGFALVRRSGFVQSENFLESGAPVKKKTQYFMQAGSAFVNRFQGALYDVGRGGRHPVYRYGKPLYLGVTR